MDTQKTGYRQQTTDQRAIDKQTFGELLQELRGRKEVTQAEVAEALGIPLSTYKAWESGRTRPQDQKTVAKLADYFGLPRGSVERFDFFEKAGRGHERTELADQVLDLQRTVGAGFRQVIDTVRQKELIKEGEAELSRAEEQKLLNDYSDWIQEVNRSVQTQSLPVPLDVTPDLEQVYIRPRVLPVERERGFPEDNQGERVRPTAEEMRRQKSHLSDEHNVSKAETRCPSETLEAILCQEQYLVLIGPAGAGKSTLLRYLAYQTAKQRRLPVEKDETEDDTEMYPVIVPLDYYADSYADKILLEGVPPAVTLIEAGLGTLEATQKWEQDSRDLLKTILHTKALKGQILFLLDGLEQVRRSKANIVLWAIESLASGSVGTHVVVASRPASYGEAQLSHFKHYRLLDLTPQDIEEFVARWFDVLAELSNQTQEWATERCAWLWQQITNEPALKAMANNPLHLTVLAILAAEDVPKPLPTRQADLYRLYLDGFQGHEGLIRAWEMQRLPELVGEHEWRTFWALARTGLNHIALWLHQAYYRDGQLRAYEDAKKELVKTFQEGTSPPATARAQTLADDVLTFWQQAGMLYKDGSGWLRVRHPVFQQYCAAQALDALVEDGKSIAEYLDNRRRDEIFDFVVESFQHSDRDVTKNVEEVLSAREDILRGNLLLASRLIATGAHCVSSVEERVVRHLVQLWMKPPWPTTEARFERALADIGGPVVFRHFETILRPKWWGIVRWEAARVLAKLEMPEAMESILDFVNSIRVPVWMRANGVAALGIMAQWYPEAMKQLINILERRKAPVAVRTRAAEVLGWVAEASVALGPLVNALNNKRLDNDVRLGAAKGLSRLGTDEAMAALDSAFQPGKGNEWLRGRLEDELKLQSRFSAYAKLRELGWEWHWERGFRGLLGVEEIAFLALPAIFHYAGVEAEARERAQEALRHLDDPEAVGILSDMLSVDILMGALQNRETPSLVREATARVLGRIGDRKAVSPLLQMLQSELVQVRVEEPSRHLATPELPEERVEQFWEDEFLLETIAVALGQLGDTSVVQPLIDILLDEKVVVELRVAVAYALAQLRHPSAVSALLQCLANLDETFGFGKATGRFDTLEDALDGALRRSGDSTSVKKALELARRRPGMKEYLVSVLLEWDAGRIFPEDLGDSPITY